MKATFLEVVEILIQKQPSTVNDLVNRVGKNQSTISRRVQKMEKERYLKTFNKTGEDNRNTLIFLNPESLEVQKYLPENFQMPELYLELKEKEEAKKSSTDANGPATQTPTTTTPQNFEKIQEELENLKKLTELLANYFNNSRDYLGDLKPFRDNPNVSKEKLYDILVKVISKFASQYEIDLQKMDKNLVSNYLNLLNNANTPANTPTEATT